MQPETSTKLAWRSEHWRWLALSCWLLVFTGLAIRLGVAHTLHTVYPIFADAARCWQRGEDMYWPHHFVPELDQYRYSPAVAQFFSIFTLLPDRLGSIFWLTLNTVLIGTGLIWWFRAALPRPFRPAQIALASLVVLTFAAGNMNNGQANTIVTAMLLLSAAAVCSGRWTQASCWIAVATMFKIYPLAFGLLLAVAFPRQLLPRLMLALLIGLAIPVLFRSPDYVGRQYQDWYDLVRQDNRRHANLTVCYRDLWLLIRVSGAPISSTAYTALQGLAAAASAALCLWGKRAGLKVRSMTMLSLNLAALWMTLLGPATESSTYLLLAPTLAWIVLDTWNASGFRLDLAILGVSLCCFYAAHLSVWLPGDMRRGAIMFQPTGAVLLAGVILYRVGSELSGPHQTTLPIKQQQRLLVA